MMFACIHETCSAQESSKLLRDCAESFSPEAELTTPQTIVFDVSRLGRLYGNAQAIADAITRHARSLGLTTNVAIAANTETAILVARNFPSTTVIPEEAAAQLAGLDIENLPISPEICETLESWGIRNFRELARLPENGIAERLGPAGVFLQRLAKGTVDRPLKI